MNKFAEKKKMRYSVEELENSSAFRLMIRIPYDGLLEFVLSYLRKRSTLTIIFWSVCFLFLLLAVFFRIALAGEFAASEFIFHTILGLIILPLISVPFHEAIHIVPYYSFGARDIKVGMDLKQYLFYVTAHRFVLSGKKFIIVAILPFLLISVTILIFVLFFDSGLWSWSLSLFLFVHATMCAGDMALINFLYVNRGKRIYTWDDAETKESFFFEELADKQSISN
jgi:hypothetical protein